MNKRGYALLGLLSILIAACAPAIAPVTPTALPHTAAPNAEATSVLEVNLLPTDCEAPFSGVSLRFSPAFWDETNFCKHSIPYDEFLSGGPPPDGIPAIDAPNFESVAEANGWLEDNWPVMFFEHEGDARAYPLAILIHHEIVNDVVGGLPVSLHTSTRTNASRG